MKILVLGAGVTGLTTAYFLARAGHEPIVVDQASEPAAGASHANGSQLSYSYTDAFARPEMISRLPGLILGRDPSVAVRLSPPLLRWGIRFLVECYGSKAAANSALLLDTALRSGQLLRQLQNDVPLNMGFRRAGKMVLLRRRSQIQAAQRTAAAKTMAGCQVSVLGPAEAAEIEPALRDTTGEFSAAIYAEGDEVADSRRFCLQLSHWLAHNNGNNGVRFLFQRKVNGLHVVRSRVRGVRCDGNLILADAVVVCLGVASGSVLRGMKAPPIFPVRGYSVTLPAGPSAPQVSLTDLQHKIVFSNLDGRIRIAGYTDFGNFDSTECDRRLDHMVATAQRIAPAAADFASIDREPWSGLRPMTPDSLPRVGPTRTQGLYLNTGHGALGWTLACATGHDVARAIEAQET